MSTAAAVLLMVAVAFYAIFGGADFGAGFWDLTAGGHRALDRTRLGGEPRLVDLRVRRVVDMFS